MVDSGASMHVVSRKDLHSAELETMRTSRSPTTVMTANSEVQTREEAAVYVKELDSIRDGCASWRNTRSSFSRENSARIMGVPTIGPAVKNHISPKKARKLIAIYQTMCHS